MSALGKLRHLATAVLVRGAGSAGNFVFLLLTARLFGVTAAGLVFNVLAIGYTASILANLGLSRFSLRSLPRLTEADSAEVSQPARVLGAQILTVVLIMALGLATLGGVGLGLTQSGLLSLPEGAGIWARAAVLGLLLGAGLLVLLGLADILKAHGRVGTAILVEVSAFPWTSVAGVGLAYALGARDPMLPAIILVLAAAMLAGIALWALPELSRGVVWNRPPGWLAEARAMLRQHRAALAIYWSSGSLVMITSRITALAAPLLLLPAETGFVAALVGIASLGGTIIAAAQAYFAPRFSRLHGSGARGALWKELLLSQAVVGGLFAVIALPVLLFPAQILALFGPEFTTYPTGLLLLAVGAQQLRCATGCAEIFLSMTARANLEMLSLLAALAVFWAIVLLAPGPALPVVVTAYGAMLVSRAALSYAAAILMMRAMTPE